MKKREEQKQKSCKSIMVAAHSVFSNKGFIDSTTAEIAVKAGVSHGLLFSHFASKDDLIIAVIELFCKNMISGIDEIDNNGLTVNSLLKFHIDKIKNEENFYYHLIAEYRYLPEQANLALLKINSAISFHLFSAAENEMKNKTIKAMPMHLLFNTWLGLLHYYISNRYLFSPSESVLKTKGNELLHHYMRIITF